MTAFTGVISFPISIYQNVPIQPGFFQPRQFFIEDITLGQTTIITATADMDYIIGQEVRLIIPGPFGCYQLNGTTGFVLSIPSSNQVEVSINSSRSDPFISSTSATQSAQIIALGDVNNGVISSTGRNIPTTNVPGAFINISPE